MSNKKFRNKGKGKKSNSRVEDMIKCPLCSALVYPRQIMDPKNKEEEEAIICASCHTDLKPYIDAYLEYAQKSAEQRAKPVPAEMEVTPAEGPQLQEMQLLHT